MVIEWRRDEGILSCDGNSIPCSCDVRNELNGRRKHVEKPVFTENEDGSRGKPYFPRPFPKGEWRVVSILPKIDAYMAPFFISTNAHQTVAVWDEVRDHYFRPTGEEVEDYGYGLHCSSSPTTLGCGRIASKDDLSALIGSIREAWVRGEEVTISVI
jgi:hypothetical protein